MGKSVFSYRSLPHWGRGTAPAVDRVLSLIVDLRCISSSVFHAARTLSGSLRSPSSPRGEGFVRRYSFSTYACIRSDIMGKAVFSYRSLPHWGRGTASAVDRVLSLIVDLRCISSFSFIRLEPYPADDTRETCHPQTFGHRPIYICGEAATTTHNPEPSNPFHFPPL